MWRSLGPVIAGIVLAAVVLPTSYFLSGGPAHVLWCEDVVSGDCIYSIYWPLGVLGDESPLFYRIDLGYREWCWDNYRRLRGKMPPEIP